MYGAIPHAIHIVKAIEDVNKAAFSGMPADECRKNIAYGSQIIVNMCDAALQCCTSFCVHNLSAQETASMRSYIEDNNLQAYATEIQSAMQYNFAHVKKLFSDRVAKIEREGGEK